MVFITQMYRDARSTKHEIVALIRMRICIAFFYYTMFIDGPVTGLCIACSMHENAPNGELPP